MSQYTSVQAAADLGRDDIAEFIRDALEEVLVDHVVLLGTDVEGHVLVGDAAQERLRSRARVRDQVGGERRDTPRECLLLGAVLLVGAAEQPVEQLGVRGEHAAIEIARDRGHSLADKRQGGFDDRGRGC